METPKLEFNIRERVKEGQESEDASEDESIISDYEEEKVEQLDSQILIVSKSREQMRMRGERDGTVLDEDEV